MKLGPYELNQIYTGDSRELIKSVPNDSIDIVFTSPPYNAGMPYEGWDDDMPENDFWIFQEQWLKEAYRVTKRSGRFYSVVGDLLLWRFKPLAESIGWRFHQLLVWCKPNLIGNRITKDWNTLTEWGLLFHKQKRTKMQAGPLNVTTHNWIVAASTQSNFRGHKRKVHPAQMPLAVAFAWLARTPGEIVLDPFIGSGTTAMAAKMLGKSYLGFEIGVITADLARHRISQVQHPLFTMELSKQAEMVL